MAANTPMLLKASMVDGRADLGLMTSGQVVGLIDDLPSVDELIDRIVNDAVAVLTRLGVPSGARRARLGQAVRPDPHEERSGQ